MHRLIVSAAIDGAAGSFDRLYSYTVPQSLEGFVRPGCRVNIPFGRGNTVRQGMIFSVSSGEPDARTKEIYEITDREPVLNGEMLKLCEWMKEHTFCTYFDAVHIMLPAGLNYRLKDYYSVNEDFDAEALTEPDELEVFEFLKKNGEILFENLENKFENAGEILSALESRQAVSRNSASVQRMGDATRKWVKLACGEDELPDLKLTKRQREIAEFVSELQSISVKELQYFTGVTVSVIDALIRKNVLTGFEKEIFRTPYRNFKNPVKEEIQLTAEQQTAFEGLSGKLDSGRAAVSLLYGVTGSGKTQVFLSLVDRAIEKGGVIVMVPEIALTPQTIDIFSRRYGDKIAVFHSAMSLGQRMDEYKRIKQKKALIAIGTRSAVFAPFEKLSLIVMDEEQEHTYKSEKNPRFHARDIAKFRVNYHNALLCLASATPSIESYTAALKGKYSLYCMKNRYGSASLPEVTTVDMKKELLEGNSGSISRELYSAVEDVLRDKKQAIILLNRRGRNTYITCPTCGYVASCPNCSVTLTYHSANHRLMCHYCGYSEPESKICPQCGSENIRFLGAGTQKVEEELQGLFPSARIVRMDADNTMTRDSYTKLLTAFGNKEYDIMLGTQMVAKGLDFPDVTLVGVIGADQAMFSEDFRSFEKTFSLLTQVVGRAGRGETAGRAVIQTTDPSSSVIELACRQDYDAFYAEEIKIRRVMTFPPYCDICVIWSQSADRALAEDAVREVFAGLKDGIQKEYSDIKLIILGPAPAAMPKMNNRYRYRMTVKCRNSSRFRELLRKAVDIKLKKDTTVTVDINPESII